jgi:hypothetical protein
MAGKTTGRGDGDRLRENTNPDDTGSDTPAPGTPSPGSIADLAQLGAISDDLMEMLEEMRNARANPDHPGQSANAPSQPGTRQSAGQPTADGSSATTPGTPAPPPGGGSMAGGEDDSRQD